MLIAVPQLTTEIYDRLGRLYQVTEPLGGGVTTTGGTNCLKLWQRPAPRQAHPGPDRCHPLGGGPLWTS